MLALEAEIALISKEFRREDATRLLKKHILKDDLTSWMLIREVINKHVQAEGEVTYDMARAITESVIHLNNLVSLIYLIKYLKYPTSRDKFDEALIDIKNKNGYKLTLAQLNSSQTNEHFRETIRMLMEMIPIFYRRDGRTLKSDDL